MILCDFWGWVWPAPAAGGQVYRPREADAAPALRLAFLADAHLKDGDERRPEAQSLARAVAELRSLNPRRNWSCSPGTWPITATPPPWPWAGKSWPIYLPPASCLWVKATSGLRCPLAPPLWRTLVYSDSPGLQVIGVHTAWRPGPGGPLFRVGDPGRRRLARELQGLDPEVPLLLVSHAPLDPVFRPWQQWTLDGPEVLAQLSRFRQVLCLHGHTHQAVASGQWPVASKGQDLGEALLAENRKPPTGNLLHLSLPATAWPQPQAVQGTPARLGPGLGPSGCGWALLAAEAGSFKWQPQVWEA